MKYIEIDKTLLDSVYDYDVLENPIISIDGTKVLLHLEHLPEWCVNCQILTHDEVLNLLQTPEWRRADEWL